MEDQPEISIESANAQTFDLVILFLGNELKVSLYFPCINTTALFVTAKDWK